MTGREVLLLKAIEECAEVQHRVSKLLQFGAEEMEAGQQKTNIERLQDEIIDLFGVIRLLGDTQCLPRISDVELSQRMYAKVVKIADFMAYGKKLGTITETENIPFLSQFIQASIDRGEIKQ